MFSLDIKDLLTLLVHILQPVEACDDVFWDQFWTDGDLTAQDFFALIPAAEIRAVREESPSNLATLCYKVQYQSHYYSPHILYVQVRVCAVCLAGGGETGVECRLGLCVRERQTDGAQLHSSAHTDSAVRL